MSASILFGIGGCLLAAGISQSASPVPLEGISALAGAEPGEEYRATPVLQSDIEFEASLLIARRYGAAALDAPPPDVDRAELLAEARRVAVLVRVLAQQARSLKESSKPEDVSRVRSELAARLGGEEPLQRLMVRHGFDELALRKWIDDVLLAASQIRYVIDQTEPPQTKEKIDAALQRYLSGLLRTTGRVRVAR